MVSSRFLFLRNRLCEFSSRWRGVGVGGGSGGGGGGGTV